VKVLRYEVKNLTPPEAILRAMQAQITAEREKRALIAKSEGEKQQEINLAEGEKQAAILTSEGQKQSAINKAQGEATALRVVADATAAAVNVVAEAMSKEGGQQAANLKNRGRVHRRARQSRQDQQHYDRADQPRRRGERGRLRHDGARSDARRSEARVRLHIWGMHMKRNLLSMIVGTMLAGSVAAQQAPEVRRVVTKLDASGKAVVMLDSQVKLATMRSPNPASEMWVTQVGPPDFSWTKIAPRPR